MTTKRVKDMMEPEDTEPTQENGQLAVVGPCRTEGPPPDPDEGEYLPDTTATRKLTEYLRGEHGPLFCSMKADTPLAKARAANALTGPADKLMDQINKTLNVVDLAITIRRFTTEEGEVLIGPRITLVCEDGKHYVFSGKVPCNSLRQILSIMGLPTWSPPLPITVTPWKGQKENRNSVTLIIDLDQYAKRCDPDPKEVSRDGRKK